MSRPQPQAIRVSSDGSFTLVSEEEHYPDIPVTTLHLSCASDVYEGPSNNYAGFVLYAHNGQTTWTLNGRKCRTGYIVVQDTSSPGVRRCSPHSEGVVHGAVYKNVFGEREVQRTDPSCVCVCVCVGGGGGGGGGVAPIDSIVEAVIVGQNFDRSFVRINH